MTIYREYTENIICSFTPELKDYGIMMIDSNSAGVLW
jgi:hypothetical protein